MPKLRGHERNARAAVLESILGSIPTLPSSSIGAPAWLVQMRRPMTMMNRSASALTSVTKSAAKTRFARVYLPRSAPGNETAVKVATGCESSQVATCALAMPTPESTSAASTKAPSVTPSVTSAASAPVEPEVRTTTNSPIDPIDPSKLGVVDQARVAMRSENRAATLVGFLLGGGVPAASYLITHQEILPAIERGAHLWACVLALLVLGGLIFSAKTVVAWANLAFADKWKAVGFGILIEGVMTLSTNHALALGALAYLVGINGIATGCRLALASPAKPELPEERFM